MTKKTEYHYNPVAFLGGIVANSSIGQPGEVLVSNGSSLYWSNSVPTTIPGMGYTGSLGFTGSQGATGFTGSSGFTGSRGFTGSQGIVGFTGSFGYTGSQGATGFTGSQGAGGFTGSQGAVGFTGSTGFTGSSGGTGFTGSRGTTGFDGSFGYTGSQGAVGFTGSSGSIGFTGSQGTVGFTGSFGFTGSRGTTGFTGSSGFTGSQGATGFTGSQGTNGFDGSFGFTGSQGIVGYTGSFGYTGSRGTTGFTGSFGFTGSQGATGFTGSQGTLGFTGSFGYTGSRGATGFDGSFGFTGSRGATGFDGSFGFTGSQGAIGFTGSFGYTGSRGATGFDGSFGFTGSRGTTGFTGSQGANGFDGSFGFTGSRGTTGFTGSFGFTGSQGTVGFTGSQGVVGFTGSFGFTGSRGTTGFDGSFGYTGSLGAVGFTGSFGFTGSRGTTGFTGSFGFTGSQGTNGFDGSVGFTGSRGATGFTGSFGFTGSLGTVGFTGSFGYTGSQGTVGFTGSQGTVGFDGSFGFTGSRGTTGFTGSFGFTGSQGSVGFTGSRGFTGSLGPTGTSGLGNAANTQILFDDSDTANGVSSFTFDKITNTVIIGNASNIYTVLSPTFIGGNSVAFLGNSTIYGDLSVTGNTTLGDAASDRININANTITITANASIDTGSIFIDSLNNRVGIRTTAPGYPLHVAATDTSDATFITGYYITTLSNSAITAARQKFSLYAVTSNLSENKSADGLTQYATQVYGSYNAVFNGSSSTGGDAFASIVAGTRNDVSNYANGVNSNSITSAYGTWNLIQPIRAPIGSAHGSYNQITQTNSTYSSITTAYATRSNITGNSAGITIGFLYYGSYTGALPTNNYGVYLTGETRNYFSGNVGINQSVPAYKLDVTGDIRATANVYSGNVIITTSASVGNSTVNTFITPSTIGGNSVALLGNTSIYGDLTVTGNANFATANITSLFIDTNANYIRGTLSDGVSNTRMLGISTQNTVFVGAIDSAANGVGLVRINAPSNASVYIYANAAFHSSFASNGNLGINTSAPEHQLDVVGTTRVTGDIIVTGNSTLGDTAADSITINAGTATLTTNLNIDSSLLYIDTLNSRIGMGIIPATLVHASGNSTTSIVRLTSNAIGLAAFDGSGPGIELTAGGMNTTNKYTPAIKFGSEDTEFTTTNPKFGASIIAEASQSYTLDTTGGMHLTFWTAPANPGTGHGLVENMRISSNGNVGIGNTAPVDRLSVTGTTNLEGNASVIGFINATSTANIGGATNLRGTLTVNGAVTIANSLATGNTSVTGFINATSTANVGGATTLRSTLTVNGNATFATNTVNVGTSTKAAVGTSWLPSGIKINWGNFAANSTVGTATFSSAFTTLYAVVVSSANSIANSWYVVSSNSTAVVARTTSVLNPGGLLHYYAIGV